jgi:exonuclease III
MMKDFLRKHDIDIALTQEITDPESVNIYGYTSHLNIGPDMRGTAIVAKKSIHLKKIERMTSGRTIAAKVNDLRIINIYAPSGTAKRTQRERFFLTELPVILCTHSHPIVLGETLTALYTR